MWIIPSSIQQSLAIAPECMASTEELKELLDQSEPLLTWKSKRFWSKTFFGALKRVYWMKLLSGRILKPSMQCLFEERYTAFLEDIPVREKVLPGSGNYGKIHGSFTHILRNTSISLDLFGGSLKTSQDTLPGLSPTFLKAYKIWATLLKQESLQRRKLVHLINEQDCSYSQSDRIMLITPTVHTQEVPYHWPTPTTMDPETSPDIVTVRAKRLKERNNGKNGTKKSGNGCGFTLGTAAIDQLQKDGLLGEESPKSHGKSRVRLNPAWVAQLMGTALEKTFFAPMGIVSLNKPQNSLSEHFTQNS